MLASLLTFALLHQGHPATYRRQADAFLAEGKYEAAADAFLKAAEGFAKRGDPNAAIVCRDYANRYRTSMRLFRKAPPSGGALARHEPAAGMILGANIEREDSSRDYQVFNNWIGRWHAMFFRYRRYGMPFPKDDALRAKRAKAALQIAFEPRSLAEVRNDDYLRRFAEDAAASGIPLFLRFAGEMNGSWVSYGGDPVAYKRAFQLVSAVMRERAPNVAMVWCPNWTPDDKVDAYYPGREAVDWVGVNFYSVIFADADRQRPSEWRFPTDHVDAIYQRYSAAHPIMVGEWAATHMSSVDRKLRPDFAIRKIREFFGTAPLLYPRLKAASWLSFNAFKYAREERQLNNYSLMDVPEIARAYAAATDDSYFVTRWEGSLKPADHRWVEVPAGQPVRPGEALRVWYRSYSPEIELEVRAGTRPIATKGTPVAFDVEVPAGAKELRLVAMKPNGGVVKTTPPYPVR